MVTPTGVIEGDVVVRGQRIAGLVPGGNGLATDGWDARGCYVLPGGVDPHAHALTDLASASIGAAHGGTTTVLTFTLPDEGESPVDALRRARDTLVARSTIDVGIHASYLDPSAVPRSLLATLRSEGAGGVQAFLAFPELGLMFDDGQLYELLRDAGAVGLTVQVQCENGALVAALTRELLGSGHDSVRYYPRSRPGAVESEAVARTLVIAGLAGVPVYLVHLSTEASVGLARAAQARGAAVTVEVCTHHLLLDEDLYAGPRAHQFVVGPPLRPAADVDALWAAIADGTVATVGSDHAHMPQPAQQAGDRFVDVPMGLPGIELRVPLVLSEGLRRGVPIDTLSDVLAAGPARAFGLYPRKGALVAGADADIVVWDPRRPTTIRGGELHDGTGHSPYTGLNLDGSVRLTVSRGRVIVRDGTLVAEPGGGRLVAPSPPVTS